MKRLSLIAATALSLAVFPACKQKTAEPAATSAVAMTPAELSALANSVPNSGPREGNNYKVFILVLHNDQTPAPGFKVDMWVKGKSEPKTAVTGANGLATFTDLPFPDVKHHLNAIIHYFRKPGNDDAREIDYPYLDTDAYRLKDSQDIPNTATPQ